MWLDSRDSSSVPPERTPSLRERRRLRDLRTKQRIIEARQEAAALELKVVAGKVAGTSFAALGRKLGYSEGYIRKVWNGYLVAHPIDDVAEFRAQQMVRLDALATRAWERVDDDPKAEDRLLRIYDQQNRLAGAYPPAQTEPARLPAAVIEAVVLQMIADANAEADAIEAQLVALPSGHPQAIDAQVIGPPV